MSKFGDVVSKLEQLNWITDSCWAIFCNFLEKNSYFNAIWINFASFQNHLKENILRVESQLKKTFPLLQLKSPKHV